MSNYCLKKFRGGGGGGEHLKKTFKLFRKNKLFRKKFYQKLNNKILYII